MFLRFSVLAMINSLLNFVIFTSFLILSEYNLVVLSYVGSSILVTVFAYFLSAKFVFESSKNNFIKFASFEFLLITVSISIYKVVTLLFEEDLLIPVIILYGSRFILAFFINRDIIFKHKVWHQRLSFEFACTSNRLINIYWHLSNWKISNIKKSTMHIKKCLKVSVFLFMSTYFLS